MFCAINYEFQSPQIKLEFDNSYAIFFLFAQVRRSSLSNENAPSKGAPVKIEVNHKKIYVDHADGNSGKNKITCH